MIFPLSLTWMEFITINLKVCSLFSLSIFQLASRLYGFYPPNICVEVCFLRELFILFGIDEMNPSDGRIRKAHI